MSSARMRQGSGTPSFCWEAVSESARSVMEELGHFGPTTRPEEGLVKGYIASDEGEDGRCYWGSGDLRKIAAGCLEVADWLDSRAKANAVDPLNEDDDDESL